MYLAGSSRLSSAVWLKFIHVILHHPLDASHGSAMSTIRVALSWVLGSRLQTRAVFAGFQQPHFLGCVQDTTPQASLPSDV